MLKSLAAGVIAIGLLLACAAVALEALGLPFQAGAADPDERAEATLSQMLANLDPRDLPSEIGDVPVSVATPEPDRSEVAVAPAPDAPAAYEPTPAALSESDAGQPAPAGKIVAQTDAGQTQGDEPAAWTPVVVAGELASPAPEAQPCTGPCAGKPVALQGQRTTVKPERRKPRRADSGPGCPVLYWLEAVLGAPAA